MIPQDADLLSTNKNVLYALASLSHAALGSSTCVDGLICAPTSPPSLQVTVGPGSIYETEEVDATAYGSLGIDTNSVLKQGLLISPATISITPPSTSGYSQVFLIEATYNDVDSGATVLPYYNSTNPYQPYSGPNNSGTSQFTKRTGICAIALKAGSAAPTGSQVAPSPDAGYVGLYAITVVNGQSTVTSANISQMPGAPFIPLNLNGIPLFVQEQPGNFSADSGSANAVVLTLPQYTVWPGPPGTPWRFQKMNANNTGAMTISNGATPVSLAWGDGSSLQAGDLQAASFCEAVSDGTNIRLVGPSGPSVFQREGSNTDTTIDQIRTGFSGLAGSAAGGAKTASWTVDQITAVTTYGSTTYRGSTLSLSFNGATTGAGGMDAGGPPASGDLSVYAIYNPTTLTWSTLGCLGTTSKGTVYSGSHMPVGYTASVLLWSGVTDSSANIQAFLQEDRAVYPKLIVIASGLTATSATSLSLAAIVPANAKTFAPEIGLTAGGPTIMRFAAMTPDAWNSEQAGSVCSWLMSTSNGGNSTLPGDVPIVTAQTTYYSLKASGTAEVEIFRYTF
jgi:hypothetical protein